MFASLTSSSTVAKGDAPKAMAPTLRSDIYSSMDQVKAWLIGGFGAGQAGDGVSFGSILSTIQKYFPDTKMGLESRGHPEGEVAIIVGGVTNMVLEMSKWDGMAGGMAMRTWIETITDAYNRVPSTPPGGRKDMLAKGLTRGVNHNTNVTLMTREFAARVQIISLLKTVSSRIYGSGSDEARQGEAFWSSKFI
jgi:hypothetical protein